MTFRKTIRAKAFNLFEAAFSKILLISPLHHATYKHALEVINGAHIAKSCHGTAQAVGLTRCKFCRHNGKLHGLLLK